MLGVGHASLDTVCRVTKELGLHSKLTGAGGGGCALTLIRDDVNASVIQQVKQALEKEGFACFEAEVGGAGVQLSNPSELKEFSSLFLS
jgi:mevalonate kinase